jgi:hypothetical protein
MAAQVSIPKTESGVTRPLGCDTGTRMFGLLAKLLLILRSRLRSRARLQAENLVFGEADLRRVLKAYASYYNWVRTHLSLNKNAPLFRRCPSSKPSPRDEARRV